MAGNSFGRVFSFGGASRQFVGGRDPADTGQTKFYDNSSEISEPAPGAEFYGQDAHYNASERQHSYTKLDQNGNSLSVSATTWYQVRDNVTGLIWEVKTDDGSIHDKDNKYGWSNAQSVFIAYLNGCGSFRAQIEPL